MPDLLPHGHLCNMDDKNPRGVHVSGTGLFSSGDAQRLLGVTYRQLTYWDRTAVVRPTALPAAGRGSRRLYTLNDVLQLKLIRRLREAGLSLQKIRRARDVIAELPDEPAPLAELEVVTDGQRILVIRSDE